MKETSVVGLLVGLGAYVVGKITMVTIVFFIFMLIDFLTGVLGSKANDEKYDKNKAEKGVLRKAGYVFFWLLAVLVELILKQQGSSIGIAMDIPLVTTAVTFWLLGTEGLSILNNLHKMGVKVPKWFVAYFDKMIKVKEEDRENEVERIK